MMRIVFNTHILRQPLTGIGRYTLKLTHALMQLGHEVHGLTVDPRHFYPAAARASSRRWIKLAATIPGVRHLQRIRLQKYLQGYTERWIYHEPNYLPLNFSGPTVITVHDLSWIRYPHTHPRARVAYLNRHFPAALQQAAHILTVSEFTRAELMDIFALPASRISVTPLGVDREHYHPHSAQTCQAILSQYQLTWHRYILSVGTLEPRKNLTLAVQAHSLLPRSIQKKYPLVLIGTQGWLKSAFWPVLEKQIRQGSVFVLGYVTDHALPCLYSGANALVYPSFYEGFGLPPLEAMACGTPVITSTAQALREVGGNATLTVAADDPRCLKDRLMMVLEDQTLVESLRCLGLQRASHFTWQACAEKTLHAYRLAQDYHASCLA
ncbi:MAG: glycosyltransferase family 1 protein [Gammaproteobacteria bacterium]|nr:glycosyltransferase family 1 protein [Gammaproteobacteria bacterium]